MAVPINNNAPALAVYTVDANGNPIAGVTNATPGSTPPTQATLVAGTDGTASRVIKTDTTGRVTLDPANAGAVTARGGSTMATGQVAVTTSSTLVAAARTGRQKITLTSTSAVVFYVGNTGVTATTGLYVGAAAGASITLDTAAAVYAVGAAAVTISFIELY